MGRISRLLTKEVAERAEEALKKMGKQGQTAIKLMVIIAGYRRGITEAGHTLGVTKATIISWIKHLRNNQIELLNVQKGRGRKPLLTPEQREQVCLWLHEDSQMTARILQTRIQKTWNVDIAHSTTHRLMKA